MKIWAAIAASFAVCAGVKVRILRGDKVVVAAFAREM